MHRRRFVALAVTLAAAAGTSLPDPALAQRGEGPDPVALLTDFYARAQREEAVIYDAIRERFLSRELVRLLERDRRENEGELGRLDFDPVSESQDPQIRDVRIAQRSLAGDRAVVDVRFRNGTDPGPDTALRYDLQRGDRGWRIIDIVKEGANGWSLLAILRRPRP